MPGDTVRGRAVSSPADERMTWIIAAFSISLMIADRAVVLRRANGVTARRLLPAVWAVDALPFIFMGVTFVAFDDNPAEVVMASMWVCFAYMLLTAARLPLTLALLLSRRRWIWLSGGAASVAVAGLFIYGMAVTRTDYSVRSVEIVSDRLPASFDGYRIVQVSDLHLGTMVRPQREVKRVVEICNGLQADMIAFCGDLVDIRYSEIAAAAPLLSRLQARDGVYSVTGNHDIGVYVRDTLTLPVEESTRRVIEAEEAMGWHVLDNATEYLRRGADSISVTGISFARDWAERRHSPDLPTDGIGRVYDHVPQRMFNVTLAHIPQLWDDIMAEGYGDVTLSGHVHAMQVKLPVGRRGMSPAALRYRRWSGLYTEHGRHLNITDGVGCVFFPMRLGARPEITVVVLRPARK